MFLAATTCVTFMAVTGAEHEKPTELSTTDALKNWAEAWNPRGLTTFWVATTRARM